MLSTCLTPVWAPVLPGSFFWQASPRQTLSLHRLLYLDAAVLLQPFLRVGAGVRNASDVLPFVLHLATDDRAGFSYLTADWLRRGALAWIVGSSLLNKTSFNELAGIQSPEDVLCAVWHAGRRWS